MLSKIIHCPQIRCNCIFGQIFLSQIFFKCLFCLHKKTPPLYYFCENIALILYRRCIHFSYYEKVGNKLNCIDEEISFKLPEGWAFIRLKTAWELISGRDLSPSDYNDKNDGIPYITGASNFKNGHVSLVRWTPVPQVITQKGDLLLTCKGTIGEIAYNNFGKAHIARQIMAIRNNYSLNVDFLALCIEYSMTKIKQAAKGLIPGISREDILNLLIPIPPTKEQEIICDKLKVTFSAIKHIEKAS